MNCPKVAVIVDLVNSKAIDNRRVAQAEILSSFLLVDAVVSHDQPLHATVGDEFQAVYPTLSVALEATLLARLALPAHLDCRFGLGLGELVDVGDGASGVIQDGSAWWLARDAINEAHGREDGRTPSARAWFRSDDVSVQEPLVNSYLLARDHIVTSMTERMRRITFGTMLGTLQSDLADAEGITQSAVSQSLRRSGGASLIASIKELREGKL